MNTLDRISITFLVCLTALMIYFSFFHFAVTVPDPPTKINNHSEYYELTYTFGREDHCRYIIHAVTDSTRKQIGYMRSHCDHQPGDVYGLILR